MSPAKLSTILASHSADAAASPLDSQSQFGPHAAAYLSKPWLKSYVKGVAPNIDEPSYNNVAEALQHAVRKYTNKTAFTCCLPNGFAGSLTFEEADRASNAFASYLRNVAGLKKGDRVAVQMPNCLAQPIAVMAIFKAGLVLVNVNPLYTEPEMEHQLNDAQAKALVIIDMFANKLTKVIPRTAVQQVVLVNIANFFPLIKRTLVNVKLLVAKQLPPVKIDAVPFGKALQLGRAALKSGHATWRPGEVPENETPVHLDDLAALQYTGGTTGVSKGAMLSHRNLVGQMQQIVEFAKNCISPGQETVITALPLYHIFAFSVNFMVFFHLGAHNILIPSPRPMSNLRKAFENYPFTWLIGVNTLFASLCNEKWFKENPPKHLRTALAGGAALLSSTNENFQRITGLPIFEGYGLTESSPVITVNPIGGHRKSESIGVPLPGTDVMIVDDKGQAVPLGERGELIAKGVQVMLGYWQKPGETQKVINSEGWLATGDIALMDADGYFKIVDRKKDMIIVSGFNVYPTEVEDALTQHPNVLEAAVIGVADNQTGEAVRAYVVLKQGETTSEELRKHCKDILTAYKVPKQIEFRTELPKTPVGKILRKDLRAEYLASAKQS